MHWFASQTKPFFPQSPFFFFFLLPRWQIIWGCCSQEPDFETNSECVCVCVYQGVCEAQISTCVQWFGCKTELLLCWADKTWKFDVVFFLPPPHHFDSCWFQWTMSRTYNTAAEASSGNRQNISRHLLHAAFTLKYWEFMCGTTSFNLYSFDITLNNTSRDSTTCHLTFIAQLWGPTPETNVLFCSFTLRGRVSCLLG